MGSRAEQGLAQAKDPEAQVSAGSARAEVTLSREDEILTALRRIIRAIDLHSRFLAQAHGLTGPQLLLLREIVRCPALPTGDLARRVSLGQATVSTILERLERKGLVRRERSEVDKRRVINVATDDGHAALRQGPSLLQDTFIHELGRLQDWEQSLLLSSLQRLARMMHAEQLPAAPVLVSGPVDISVADTASYLSEADPQKPDQG